MSVAFLHVGVIVINTVLDILADERYTSYYKDLILSEGDMATFVSCIQIIEDMIGERRRQHTLFAALTALKLNNLFKLGQCRHKIIQAAMFHDCARNFTKDELLLLLSESNGKQNLQGNEKLQESQSVALLHGRAGALLAARDFGISDPEILEAIEFHTTGKPVGSAILNLIIVADTIEPSRKFHSEVPVISDYSDFSSLLLEVVSLKIQWVVKKKHWLSPVSVDAFNYVLKSVIVS